MVGGEPMTDARRQQMEAAGARVIAVYSSVELGGLSYSCATPLASDDIHLMTDRFSLVQRPRPSTDGGPVVDALLFTTLSPATGKISLNTETGDYARVEDRDCGCLLGELGLNTHLSEIRSFEKVTGEGASFVRTNLERILEEVLPVRFGGTSVDYQLAEEEDVSGATRLVLRVSPSVGDLDEALLRATLLEEIGRGGLVNRYHAGLWRDADSVTIRREAPLATRVGKVLPFQLLQRTQPAGESDRRA
jgi:phenylacetate-coenzyme A ligase PaaK-like adenylate-forming protein